MKKKILAIAMTAIVAALGLTGCNNGMGINDVHIHGKWR